MPKGNYSLLHVGAYYTALETTKSKSAMGVLQLWRNSVPSGGSHGNG